MIHQAKWRSLSLAFEMESCTKPAICMVRLLPFTHIKPYKASHSSDLAFIGCGGAAKSSIILTHTHTNATPWRTRTYVIWTKNTYRIWNGGPWRKTCLYFIANYTGHTATATARWMMIWWLGSHQLHETTNSKTTISLNLPSIFGTDGSRYQSHWILRHQHRDDQKQDPRKSWDPLVPKACWVKQLQAAANGVGFIQNSWRIGNVKVHVGGEPSV